MFTDLNWNLVLPALDDDPVDPGTPRGNKSNTQTLRRTLTVLGRDTLGNALVWTDGIRYQNTENINFTIGAPLAPGPATLEVELCDCLQCETNRGTGRCTTIQIPVVYQPPTPPTASLARPGTR